MPTYPVINLESKETKVLNMTMKEYTKWREDIPVGTETGHKGVQAPKRCLDGRARLIPLDGMKSWTVHLNNQVPLSAKTAITNSDPAYAC